MTKLSKQILSALLVLTMLTCFAGAAMGAQTIYQLTVEGVDGFGGGDVEVGTDLSLVLPENPTKTGYRFTGWTVTNASGTVIEAPSVMPAYDVTFTAQWESTAKRYTITFLSADGEIISGCDYLPGETIVLPDYPGEGYRLVAWRNANTGRVEQIPAVMPERNLEYLAVIEEIYYTITFIDGDNEIGEVTVGMGEKAEIIEPVPQSGKIFAGWSLTPDGEVVYRSGDAIDLTENMDLYAVWTTVTQPTIALKYPTLVFEDVIMMNVYFSASDLEDVTEMGLITYTENVTEWNVDNAHAVVPGYNWSEADGLYYATTKGIAAKDLGDEIYFAVYAKLSDGSYYYTRLVPYSPRTYAYSSLATGSVSMRPIVVAMLNYGAAAQNYFNYKTDNLVNADLTAEQKALVEDYRSDMITAVASPDAAKQGALALNGGYARRYPTVSFEGAFCINYYATPTAAPVDGITMYYWAQEDYEKAEVLTLDNATASIPMTGEGVGEYHAAVEGIAAKDLSRGVYVCFVYSDGADTYYSGVLAYSIGTYCAAQAAGTGTTAALAQATAVYGYYANELFNK